MTETPAEKIEAEEGNEPKAGSLTVETDHKTFSWFARVWRYCISKIYNPIPVDPSALVYFGIRELRIGNVYLEAIPRSGDWKLHENLRVTWIDLDGSQEVEFLAGLETDLASIPRVLWRVIPPHKTIKRPAVVHDFLYRSRPFLLVAGDKMKRIDRGKADRLLYVAMRAATINKETADAVYIGVRIGGGPAWHKYDDYFAGVDAAALLVRDAETARVLAEAENVQVPGSDKVDVISATGDADIPADDLPDGVERLRKDGSDSTPP